MATYVILGRWTGQGIENIKQGPKRLAEIKKGFKKQGVTSRSFHLTLGQYDFVMIVEAESADTLAGALLAAVSKGNAHTETLRAFTEDEYRTIVEELP